MAKPGYKIELKGFQKFQREAIKAGNRLGDLKAAYVRAGRIILDAAQKRVPVRSGTLRKSGRSSKLGNKPVKRVTRTVTVSYGRKKIPYANPIHWGWQKRNINENPWLSKAAQKSEKRWLKVFERDIRRIMKKVKGA